MKPASTISSAAANETTIRFSASTGVRFGGALTDLGAGVVRISAGEGQIIDNTDPALPIMHHVIWPQTDVDLSLQPDGVQNFIFVDSTNTVQFTTTKPTHGDYRLKLPLHRVVIRSGAMTGDLPIVQPSGHVGPANWDVWEFLGLGKKDKSLMLSGDGAGGLNVTAGEIYEKGSNFYVDPTNPSEIEFNAANTATFRLVTQLNAQSADLTVFDVTNYDNGGVVEPMSNNRWGIYELYKFANGNIRILRPQTEYLSFVVASEALRFGGHSPIVPSNFEEAFRLGWIIFEKGDTNLTNADFVTANKFGGVGGAVSSIGVGYVPKVASTDNAVPKFNGTSGDVQNSGVIIDDDNNLSAATVNLAAYTVASLPTVGAGSLAYVTDSNDSITYRGTVVAGGGAQKALVLFDGTNWIYH